MRITNIEVTNFQGLQRAALVVSEPLLLVSGDNGAGKSSLLDAVAMAFTGQPRRVSLKKDIGQLVTEGQKKGEVHVTYVAAGEEQTAWAMLPTGKSAPVGDSPYLPYVLDAAKFAGLDGKERRKMLFELTGAVGGAAAVAQILTERGADMAKFEKVKPLLRHGFPGAAEQAKEYASEARGAWKAITGEAYGSEKAKDWEPELPPTTVKQQDLDAAAEALQQLDDDLSDAQQTLGGHKAAAQAASQRQARIDQLYDLVEQVPRRAAKLKEDEKRRDEWDAKLADARRAAEGEKPRTAMECPCCNEKLELSGGVLVKHVPAGKVADPEAARRVTEYAGYLDSAVRAVANSQRDLNEATSAADQLVALEQEAANAPNAQAIANAEQAINELRQQRDAQRARFEALRDAMAAVSGRDKLTVDAARHHSDVVAWSFIADQLSPTGIPAEILAGALTPMNDLLAVQSAAAKWAKVQISPEIEVTYGGRLYGLLSESEKWRCDALLAIAIARLSGLRFVALDRFDVLQPSARPQVLGLLRTLTQGGDLDTAVLAGTMKEPMAKVPSGIQAIWIEGGVIANPQAQAA